MKRYYITAAIIAALNLAIYPLMRHLAYLERGYHAHGGGEDFLLIAGFFAALMVIYHGREKTCMNTKKRADRSQPATESDKANTTLTRDAVYHCTARRTNK